MSDGNAFVVVEVMHALRDGATVAGARDLPLPNRVRAWFASAWSASPSGDGAWSPRP